MALYRRTLLIILSLTRLASQRIHQRGERNCSQPPRGNLLRQRATSVERMLRSEARWHRLRTRQRLDHGDSPGAMKRNGRVSVQGDLPWGLQHPHHAEVEGPGNRAPAHEWRSSGRRAQAKGEMGVGTRPCPRWTSSRQSHVAITVLRDPWVCDEDDHTRHPGRALNTIRCFIKHGVRAMLPRYIARKIVGLFNDWGSVQAGRLGQLEHRCL